MSSLFVGNLSSHIRHRELENTFRRFGSCSLELKEGFGFVVYEEHRDAKRALEALQGRAIFGEQPSISWARKRRPFQRFSGKGNFIGRERYHSRRRSSLEVEIGSDDGRRDEKFVDEMKDGLRASEARDEATRYTERDADWKDSGPERPVFEEETKDSNPMDSGRWDPHMEGSPDNALVGRLFEDEQHHSDDKDKEEERGSVHEKSQGSPRNKHHDRSSRMYCNATDQQHKRGRETFGGRRQERCYNCGQSGHVKWQCRSRPRRTNMYIKEGGYDGRRNEFRCPSIRGGFRGMGGNGRFRGFNGSRRILSRDVEPGYARRSSRRQDADMERKHSDPADTKIREKRRHRHRSESPKDSSSRERSKRKHKKSSKMSSRITKKWQRSSSGSPSSSRSPRSTSSSRSPSRSLSRSTSKSQSSKSGSDSSGSGSRSRSSDSQSSKSRSLSASLSSRSRSASARSRKSVIKSRSQSPLSRSVGSHGISSPSPKGKMTYSPRSSSAGGSHSSTYMDDKKMATPSKRKSHGQGGYVISINDVEEKKDNSDQYLGCQDLEQQRSERRRVWSREAKKQKIQSRSDDEEPPLECVPQPNGMGHAAKSIEAVIDQHPSQHASMVNNTCSGDLESLKGSEFMVQGQVPDTECNVYLTIMKHGGSEAAGSQDRGSLKFDAARLWPWEAMLYRRFRREPVSTANYERRKAQNEEFGIKDTFVRSSSGWWENHSA